MTALTVAYDSFLPLARWGPLFHVFCLEQPGVALRWHRTGFPQAGRPLLGPADVGLLIQPPRREGLRSLALDVSPLCVIMAVGHRLARHHELEVADVLDQPFSGGPRLDPEWAAFWTLDARRGAPAGCSDDDMLDAEQALDVVAAGRAIATVPAWMANALPHPGIVAVPLRDGPKANTALVWPADDERPAVHALVDLAGAWTRGGSVG
jgi:DNA-binding transcriptional LysR family regulator